VMRYGMLLSKVDDQLLGRFRYMFFKRSGLAKDNRVIIHAASSIVSYGRRGWSFDQQLGHGFKMVFRHYGLQADEASYGKYDHLIYIDVETDAMKPRDEAQQKIYEVKKKLAEDVTQAIEGHLKETKLGVELTVPDKAANNWT